MYDNILNQSACQLLSDDIRHGVLPGSMLFSGPASSGKLSCALETARILSCRSSGEWSCGCPSCLRHKAMVSQNLLLLGSSSRTLEIAAAKRTILEQSAQNSSHLEAARYLYLRAVRKLTARFSPVLWEGEDKLSKFAPIMQSIDDSLELLQPGRVLPEGEALAKITGDIERQAEKLESGFLYDSVPVSQIRNFSAWAHLSSASGKKVLVIENADMMQESARNALLKILEEPPEDTRFILTTSRRSAMLPTILSRVRTYSFFERTVEQQRNVISRVFHYAPHFGAEPPSSISDFLQMGLPVSPGEIRAYSEEFFGSVAAGRIPDIARISAGCGKFEPRILFRIFLEGIAASQRKLLFSARGAESSALVMRELARALSNVSAYNQNPASALEELVRSLMQINFLNRGSLRLAADE